MKTNDILNIFSTQFNIELILLILTCIDTNEWKDYHYMWVYINSKHTLTKIWKDQYVKWLSPSLVVKDI